MRVVSTFLAVVCLLACSASATTTSQACFREDLDRFLADLGTVPGFDRDRVIEARTKLAATADDELRPLQANLAAVPRWRDVPVLVASLAEADQQFRHETVARFLAEPPGGPASAMAAEQERTRAVLLFFLAQTGRIAAVFTPERSADVARLQRMVETTPPENLHRVADALVAMSDRISITEMRGPIRSEGINCESACNPPCEDDPTGACDLACEVGCEIVSAILDAVQSIVDGVAGFFEGAVRPILQTVASLPSTIANVFNGLFDSVRGLFASALQALTDGIPNTVAEALAYAGIDPNNLNWNNVVSSLPRIMPPCPQAAASVAADICDRGGDFITELAFNLAPEDGVSVGVKLGLAAIHFPLAYLCQCYDGQQAIAFADAAAAHRTYTGQKLDVQLSTRATQSSVNVLSASVANVAGDVSRIDGKMNVLGANAARINANVNYIESTVNTIKAHVDIAEAETGRSEVMIDALTQGNSEQHTFVGDFTTLLTRFHIENNLLANRTDTVSIFQLPAAWGGQLEAVGLIVADTIAKTLSSGQSVNGAERELQRGDGLRLAGDFVKAYEAYRSAYAEAVK